MSLSSSFFEERKKRQATKQVHEEGLHLAREGRRVLKKKSYRIPEAARAEVEAAIVRFEEADAGTDREAQREALTSLDEAMDKHLAFARKSTVREYSESIGVAVLIALLLRAFVVEAFQIPSGSMIPTLEIGDHIFVSKFTYGLGIPFTNKKIFKFHDPQRGDVIVFKHPPQPDVDFIKRVVGLPGDHVEVRKNQVFINGQPMPREHQPGECSFSEGESALGFEHSCDLWMETLGKVTHKAIFVHQEPTDWPGREGNHPDGTFTVPQEAVFVMGDNRDNSSDSRVWGTVPFDNIKGRALIVWWSRAPAENGVVDWFKAIRWGRFFTTIK